MTYEVDQNIYLLAKDKNDKIFEIQKHCLIWNDRNFYPRILFLDFKSFWSSAHRKSEFERKKKGNRRKTNPDRINTAGSENGMLWVFITMTEMTFLRLFFSLLRRSLWMKYWYNQFGSDTIIDHYTFDIIIP